MPAREAGRVFAAARHPKSLIALDGADHDVGEPRHARRVAGLVAAWAAPYLPDHAPSPPLDPTGSVVVTDAGTDVGMLSRIRSEIDIEGPLNDQDRRRLVEIADRCPVHRTLSSEITFETTQA